MQRPLLRPVLCFLLHSDFVPAILVFLRGFPLPDFLSHHSLASADPCRLGSAFPEGKAALHHPAPNRRVEKPGWRIRPAVLWRDVCVFWTGAQTCQTTARLRHPRVFFMGFRGPKAHGSDTGRRVCAGLERLTRRGGSRTPRRENHRGWRLRSDVLCRDVGARRAAQVPAFFSRRSVHRWQ
jgi:hypothetical protein